MTAEVIARQLGKGLLLSVAHDLDVDPSGLSFAVRGRHDLDRVRIVGLGLDRFRIEVGGSCVEPLYGFQLADTVRAAIGEYEDVRHEVNEIFRDAQERYVLDRVTMAAYYEVQIRAHDNERKQLATAMRVGATELRQIRKRDAARKAQMERLCACGCGGNLPPSRFTSRRKYVSKVHGTRVWRKQRVPTSRLMPKLNETKVRYIFELRARGQLQREIGNELGVTQAQISSVLCGKSWSHLGLSPTRRDP